MALAHALSWSVSRAGTFDACRRRYYLDYYLGWNGWLRSAPESRQLAWRLKKMTRMPMLAGDVLHQAIAEHFDRRAEGRELPREELLALALKKLRAGYKESRDGAGLWRDKPSQSVHLAEHHYEESCVDESTSAAGDYGKRFVGRLEAGAACFFEESRLAAVREVAPGDLLCVEGRAPARRDVRDLPTIELACTPVYAIPDLALRLDGRVHVYDWKSGSPRPQDEFQLGVYALYAAETWGVAPEEVVCVDAYLTRGELVEKVHTREELEAIQARVEASLAEMRDLHFAADDDLGDEAAFPRVEEGSRECESCNYRQLCDR